MRRTTITFTNKERDDLLLSWGILSLAFAILFTGGITPTTGFLLTLGISLLITAIAFILHELAHKFVAVHYGCEANYKANKTWLVVALIMSFFGFIFAAPGAVMIRGHVTRKQQGHIALAGPAVNLLAAIIFLPLARAIPAVAKPIVLINALLAAFNLLPLPGFDGSKVLDWHKGAYAGFLAASVIVLAIAYL